MQCVMLAAGRGTRMEELTGNIPKPMLSIGGRTLLEYKLDALPDDIDEIIFIIGYLGHVVRERFADRYEDKRIRYVEQVELNGTAGALWQARDIPKDRFLVMMGDDLYAKQDIEEYIATKEWALLVQQVPEMHRAGNVELNTDVHITGIVEGDRGTKSGLASTNLFALDTRLFTCPLVPKLEGSLEYGLPQTVMQASRTLGIRLEPGFTDQWIQITSPNDLVRAEEALKKMNDEAKK